MPKTLLGLLILALIAIDGSNSGSSAQTQVFFFQFMNKASNRCIRVEEPPPKAIITGFVRTFSCGKTRDRLIDVGNSAPAQLKFDLGGGDLRCIKVRGIDMKKFPSDIFTHNCVLPISGWHLGGGDADGFGDVRLFTLGTETLCMAEDTLRRTVVIDECADKPEQLWKRVSVPLIIN
jgi:hypothetical protein